MPVIATTFAGRRDRMSLLVDYVVAAIDAGIVTAYHVWDYARTEVDRRWLHTLPQRHPAISVLTPAGHHARYRAYYRHYRREDHEGGLFLKLDDDIVYLSLDRLAAFVDFRVAHPEYFLVSASVVNNGVCAHFQQQRGAIPPSLMELPYPDRGFCGRLWEHADLAERLHDFFLDDPGRFDIAGVDIAPDRLSINCVAYLGSDLDALVDVGDDDEQDLSVTIPRRLQRRNAIFHPMLASHLSFFSQEGGMDVARLLDRYRALARHVGVRTNDQRGDATRSGDR
jgi:hypothetical protein